MVPHATIEHQLARRTRLKIPEKRNDEAYFGRLEAFFRKQAEAEMIKVRPAAASIVIEHTSSFGPIAARAASEGLFTIPSPGARQVQSSGRRQRTQARARGTPRSPLHAGVLLLGAAALYRAAVARDFGYAVDNLWNAYGAARVLRLPVLASALAALGVRQLAKGRWFGSASSLLVYAIFTYQMAQDPPASSDV